MIGFAGPRVIKETTQQDLPPGFQRSEFLLKHGLLDLVVPRRDLKAALIRILDYIDPVSPAA
jgi:acetyl-CoA carboxylase carboxyl transferase subunit beta